MGYNRQATKYLHAYTNTNTNTQAAEGLKAKSQSTSVQIEIIGAPHDFTHAGMFVDTLEYVYACVSRCKQQGSSQANFTPRHSTQ